MDATFDERQQAFRACFDPGEDGFGPPDATVLVLPSHSFPPSELRKITAITHYEERLLCLLLLLGGPGRRVVYVTSMPVDDAVVDYHLAFLPDPVSARDRLQMVSVGDPRPLSLSAKLLDRPEVLERIHEALDGAATAYLLPFNVTEHERRVADRLRVPLYGPGPELAALGSKTGSRHVARRAGVAVLDGDEDLSSIDQIDDAIRRLRAMPEPAEAVVVKLNDGFSGQGNAIVDCRAFFPPVTTSPTTFCADGESWTTYAGKVAAGGAVIERLLSDHLVASPSVQVRIAPGGDSEILSTHDQILGGAHHQVYLGCRFPAGAEYRALITHSALLVADVLRRDGVIGGFGVDFFVRATPDALQVALSEINLRLGGTTHPLLMARLLTGGRYNADRGALVDPGGRETCYVASDNLRSPNLAGASPTAVLTALDRTGLGWDRRTGEGATCHLLGALREYGKMGVTCMAGTSAEADDLYREVTGMLASDLAPVSDG